jgi:hydroxymethylbilane synthase
MNEALKGGCQVPIAGHARVVNGRLQLRGRVLSPDGKIAIEAHSEGPQGEPEKLGAEVAEQLLLQGAGAIISQCY